MFSFIQTEDGAYSRRVIKRQQEFSATYDDIVMA